MRTELLRDDGVGTLAAGVILLVAIGVVLVSTAMAFAVGFAGQADAEAPRANFTYEYSQLGNGNLTIVHERGEDLDPGAIHVATDSPFRPAPGNDSGTLGGSAVESYGLDGVAAGSDWVDSDIGPSAEFGIVGEPSTSLERITVRIVWTDPASGDTVVLGEWQGPDA